MKPILSALLLLIAVSAHAGGGSALFASGGATGAAALNGQSVASVTFSSMVFIGVNVSTQAAGGAGSSVTATCNLGTYVMGGGCDCASAVAITEVKSIPNCVTAGCIATGWTCQEPGGTGGQCSAFAICSRAQ